MSLGSVFLPPATADESARIAAAKKAGCVICALLQASGRAMVLGQRIEYHHFKQGNVTVGHRFGVALCLYHHKAILPRGCTQAQAREEFGPTVMSSNAFHNRFGSDQQLLDDQDELINWPRATIERTRHRPDRSRCIGGRKIYKPTYPFVNEARARLGEFN